jgi:WD40 repeat protein
VNHKIRILTTAKGKEVVAIDSPGRVRALAFQPGDGLRVIAAGDDRILRVWQKGAAAIAVGGGVNNAVFTADGECVVAATPTVRMWNALTHDEVTEQIPPMSSGANGRVALSPDGRFLYAGSTLMNLATGDKQFCRPGRVIGPAFSPDGKLLAVCTDSLVTVYELPSLRELYCNPCPGMWTVAVAFSPDSKCMAVGSGGGAGTDQSCVVQIWQATSGQRIRTLENDYYSTWDLAFSPDGRYLAAACGVYIKSGAVKVWEVATGREIAALGGYEDCVWKVAFSPDGRRLATASGQWNNRQPEAGKTRPKVRIWDVSSWQEVVSLRDHTNAVYSVAYSPDGRRLVTGSQDGTIRIWGPGTPPD